MKTIYKYELEITDEQAIFMPASSKIISAKNQNEKICIWVMVKIPCETFKAEVIYIYGTGNPVGPNLDKEEFIDTVIMGNGLVWHVFNKK